MPYKSREKRLAYLKQYHKRERLAVKEMKVKLGIPLDRRFKSAKEEQNEGIKET
jgi:hypothetical protein